MTVVPIGGRVPAVATTPRRLGSVLTATAEGDPANDNWRHGAVQVWSESAPGWRLVSDLIADPEDWIDHGAKSGGSAPVGARGFVIQTFAQCPRGSLDELRDRAERQLDTISSQAIAREMWTGELTKAGPWTLAATTPFTVANPRSGTGTGVEGPWLNPYLTAVDPDDMWAAPHPAAAVGRVEALAMARVAGGPVFIHVPPELLLELSQFGIHSDGDRLTTPLGNVVVADAGYGSAVREPGDPLAVYATGPVQVWIGSPVVFDDPSEIVDTNTNQVGVWAERPALYLFDPQTAVGCTIEET